MEVRGHSQALTTVILCGIPLQGFGYIALKYSTYLQGAGVSPNVLFVDGMWSSSCTSCPTFTTSGTQLSHTVEKRKR